MVLSKEMLIYLRTKENLSQAELAEKLGIAKSIINMYEVGKREPEFDAARDAEPEDLIALHSMALAFKKRNMEIPMTQDVNVILIDFHRSGKEMVVENEDGSFTILTNSNLSNSGQIAAYNHTMKHINDGDFQKECVQTVEFTAHDISIPKDAEHIPADKYIRQIKAIQRRRRLTGQNSNGYSDMIYNSISPTGGQL